MPINDTLKRLNFDFLDRLSMLIYPQYDHHDDFGCRQAGILFVKVLVIGDIMYIDFTNPHEAWYGCSPPWLIQNRRFVSLGVYFPLC